MTPALAAAGLGLGLGLGLDPTPDQARSWLRRELLRPDYQDRDVVRRLLDRLSRLLSDGIGAASSATWVQTLASMVVLLALAAGLVWLLSRARRTGAVRTPTGVLSGEPVTADRLHARAEAAWSEGRWDEALVEGFRALARRQVERGRLEDDPGATAHEVAVAVAVAHPERAATVRAAADDFDAVRYGSRPATAEQARAVLALDDDLATVR